MPPLSETEIANIATLARLNLEDSQDGHSLQTQLAKIMQMIDQIMEANTDNIPALSHPLEMSQPLRPDEITEPNQRELLLGLAPQAEAGLFLVPAVIEDDS